MHQPRIASRGLFQRDPWACPAPPGQRLGRLAPVVVHEPFDRGSRQVSVQGVPIGTAHNVADVLSLIRRFGVELPAEEADGSPLIEWRGGGSQVWGG